MTLRRIVVTGGTGFIGARLVRRLIAAGAEVALLDQETAPLGGLADIAGQFERYDVDIRNGPMVRRAMEKARPEIVFHLAAVGVSDPFLPLEEALRVNVTGTVNVIQNAREARRIVHAGTCYELGDRPPGGIDPISTYAASKASAWAFARMLYRTEGAPVVGVRPFQVYGPGQPASAVLSAALASAGSGQDFPMTPAEQVRDWVFVDDVIDGLIAASNADGVDGEIFDLGTGLGHSLREVVESLFALAGTPARPIFGALPYRPGEVMRLVADPGPASERLGWVAKIDLEEGLKRLIS
ncbi:MAG: SDR family NAD(P)-dependent oxidoreductase [Chloroflexi bacterium]|nr:SDR family NAD(P)-dependent oxidoreductase [Chloroflexota bacterium]